MAWWVSPLSSFVRMSTISFLTDFPYVFDSGYLILLSAYPFYGWLAQIKTGKIV
jgi:hypothetical protein